VGGLRNDTDSTGIAAGNDGAAREPRRFLFRRAVWHSAGFLLALAIAWLVFRAYRQPDFLIDLVNMQLC
jgi:uncharacterized membrane protein